RHRPSPAPSSRIDLLTLKLLVRWKFRVPGIVRALRHGRSALAHVHNLGTGKAREHRLYQRIPLRAGLELGLPRLVLRSDGGLALLGRYHDHPAPVGPLRELAREIVDQRLGGAWLQRDFETAVLAAHKPHVAFERKLDAEVALLRGECDQILEARDSERRRTRLRLGETRHRIARWGKRAQGGTQRGLAR